MQSSVSVPVSAICFPHKLHFLFSCIIIVSRFLQDVVHAKHSHGSTEMEQSADGSTHGRQLKKKKKGKGKSGGGGDCSPGECCVCDGDKPNTLTLKYIPAGKTSLLQTGDKASCRAGAYPAVTGIDVTDKDNKPIKSFSNVTEGSILTIEAPNGSSKFSSETNFRFDTQLSGNPNPCYIHTSVSDGWPA
jgi:hypothetical protein